MLDYAKGIIIIFQVKEIKMALYEDQLREILNYYKKLIIFYKQEINQAPPGRLYCQNSHGKTQFLHSYEMDQTQIRRGVNRDIPLQKALARKEFARKALPILEQNVRNLEKALKGVRPFDPDEILQSMTKAYALLPEDYFFDRNNLEIDLHLDHEMEARIARHNGYGQEEFHQYDGYPEYRKHRTSLGIYVRSKSEALILEMLKQYGAECHYEHVRYYGAVKIVPDFTFEDAHGRPFYWEHMGMMDDPMYAARNKQKINDYFDAGLILGKDVILTFDRNGSINVELIDTIIQSEIIPRL